MDDFRTRMIESAPVNGLTPDRMAARQRMRSVSLSEHHARLYAHGRMSGLTAVAADRQARAILSARADRAALRLPGDRSH